MTQLNRIGDMTLNLTCDNAEQASQIENRLYDFARNDLMNALDRSLDSFVSEDEDIILDDISVDLGAVPEHDAFGHIVQRLVQQLTTTIRERLLKKQCTPVAKILQDTCGQRLTLEKSTMLEKTINNCVEEWCKEHVEEKFDPLHVAEVILKRVQAENPGLDIRQIACSVFESLKKLGEKKPSTPAARPPKAGDCGIVLIAPYISMLLEKAGCAKAGIFIDDESKKLAVALLNYTVFGNYEPPKTEKSIAQLICGFDAGEKLAELPVISDELKALADSLLQGVIANWGALGHTSVDGLRASFLIRQGILDDGEEGPTLTVENSAYDMLLDKLPWGYSTVKLSWMKSPLHVKWR